MTFLSDPQGYTQKEFSDFVKTLKWKVWKPRFVVLHNTFEPTLAQWIHNGLGYNDGHRRICNLNHYYHSKGWHSGPTLFIAPDLIWNACDLEQDGVHCSCWNRISLGVEMVGDFSSEEFDSGNGAKVRDNTIAALAVLHNALDLKPDNYAMGHHGLHFHHECIKDHHGGCPGTNVSKEDVVKRILTAMEKL